MGLTPLKIEGHLKIGVHPLLSLKKAYTPLFSLKRLPPPLLASGEFLGIFVCFLTTSFPFSQT